MVQEQRLTNKKLKKVNQLQNSINSNLIFPDNLTQNSTNNNSQEKPKLN